MKLLTVLPVLALTFLVSCGDDLGGNRKSGAERRQDHLSDRANQLLHSHMHRLGAFQVLTYLEEIQQTLGNNLGPVYRQRAIMGTDDEGANGQNVRNMNTIGRPNVSCGLGDGFAGIDSRIVDCNRKNPERSLWNGMLFGNAGEGTWKLVAKSDDGKEYWLDVHSGMVWSDTIEVANWCKAAGNRENDCANLSEGVSLCQGMQTPGIGLNIHWRLPTRNDYLQADINGLRAVLKKSTTNSSWTATMRSRSAMSEAWTYDFDEGTLSAMDISDEAQVHCIGSPVR